MATNATDYGIIAGEQRVQKQTAQFLFTTNQTLTRLGYPAHRKVTDPETKETRWVWASRDGQSKVEFLGIDETGSLHL